MEAAKASLNRSPRSLFPQILVQGGVPAGDGVVRIVLNLLGVMSTIV